MKSVETSFRSDDPKNVLRSIVREYRFHLDVDSYYLERSGEGWDPQNSRVTNLTSKVLETTEEAVSLSLQPERPRDQIANYATIKSPDSTDGFWRKPPVPSLVLVLYAPSLLPANHILSPNNVVLNDDAGDASTRIARSQTQFDSATWVLDESDRPKQLSMYSRDGGLVYEVHFQYDNSADGTVLPRWTQRFFDDGKLLSETTATVTSVEDATSPAPSIDIPNGTFVSNSIDGSDEDPVEYWKDASGQMVRLSDEDMLHYLPLPPDQWPKPKETSWIGWMAAGGLVIGLTAILTAALWNRRRRRMSHR